MQAIVSGNGNFSCHAGGYGGGGGGYGQNASYKGHGPIARNEAPPRIVPIASLNSYQSHWTIKARITNKSEIRRYSNARGEGTSPSLHGPTKTVISMLDDGCLRSPSDRTLPLCILIRTTNLSVPCPAMLFCALRCTCSLAYFFANEETMSACTLKERHFFLILRPHSGGALRCKGLHLKVLLVRAGKLFSFELLDAQGGEIRGCGFNQCVDKFEPIMQQGAIIMMSKASLKNKKAGSVRPSLSFSTPPLSLLLSCADLLLLISTL